MKSSNNRYFKKPRNNYSLPTKDKLSMKMN